MIKSTQWTILGPLGPLPRIRLGGGMAEQFQVASAMRSRGMGQGAGRGMSQTDVKRELYPSLGTGALRFCDPVVAACGWDRNKGAFVFSQLPPSSLFPQAFFSSVPLQQKALNCFFPQAAGKVKFHRVAWGEGVSGRRAESPVSASGHMMQVWMD